MPQATSPDIHSPKSQENILLAMLEEAPSKGWSMPAFRAAVVSAGFQEGDEFRAFQGNLDVLHAYFIVWADQQMIHRLKDLDLSSMRVKDRVATAVMVRLRLLNPYKQAVRASIDYCKHPTRASLALKAAYKTVNEIWYLAGDTATDFNFYSKRTLLGGVYASTVSYWLDDDSEDNIKTRAHLSLRLDQVMQIPKYKARAKDALNFALSKIGLSKSQDPS